MRITSNMLVQQLVQAVKSEGSQKPEVGAVINARIAQVLNGALTLDIGSGRQVIAQDLSGRNFQPGQTVSFVVVGFDEGGTLQIRPSTEDAALDPDSHALSGLLKNLNLTDTPQNRELLRTLSAYRIPLTAENVKAVQDMRNQAKAIVQLTDQTGTAVLSDEEDAGLKQIAAKLIEMTGPSGKETSLRVPLQGKAAADSIAAVPAGKVEEPEAPVDEGSQSILTGEDKSAGKISVSQKNALPLNPENQRQKAQITSSPLNMSEETAVRQPAANEKTVLEDQRGKELKEILKQLTFEKIVFVLKNQLPADVKTIEAMEKLVSGKKDLGVQLNELLGNLPDDEAGASIKEMIRSIGKAVHVSADMNPFELQKQLKSLSFGLTALSAQIAETPLGNQSVKESLAEVKNSLDFLGRLNESATYLHVPVALGEGTKPLDLYVQRDKSGKKKVNPKDTKIFISLETNHLQTVQCLVEIREKKLDIGFKLKDENALSLIGSIFDPLKESLAQLGYNDVMIHGIVYERPLNLMDVVQESTEDLRRIDMKV